MPTFDIMVPETKPATEWVRGRALQKVSPGQKHALLQLAFALELRAWARGKGRVGTEWDFRVTPPGERTRPLVPDVAYVSFAKLDETGSRDVEFPRMAPEVVVEIRSPSDAQADIDDKVATYLRAGTSLIIEVDPRKRIVRSRDAAAMREFFPGDHFEHPVLPGFSLDLRELFAELD